jgi:hypothetical protein
VLSEAVGRTLDAFSTSIEHEGINHCSGNILVPEEFLDSTDIVTVLQEVSGEGMAERMARDRLCNTRPSCGTFYGSLDYCFMEVMPEKKVGSNT